MDHNVVGACLGGAAVSGILSHLLYFIRGEHHKQALQLLQITSLFTFSAILLLFQFTPLGIGKSIQLSLAVVGSYLTALWTSMTIYRAFFHRLHHFPGPWYLKLSKFNAVIALRKTDGYRKTYGWHQKYGNFVRTGTWLKIPMTAFNSSAIGAL